MFSCAKEHRTLPKQGFTCCLAMDGVKVLASGFEADEKVSCFWYVNLCYNICTCCLSLTIPWLRGYDQLITWIVLSLFACLADEKYFIAG